MCDIWFVWLQNAFFGLKVGSPTFFIYQIIVAIVEESRSTVYLDFALLPTTAQE